MNRNHADLHFKGAVCKNWESSYLQYQWGNKTKSLCKWRNKLFSEDNKKEGGRVRHAQTKYNSINCIKSFKVRWSWTAHGLQMGGMPFKVRDKLSVSVTTAAPPATTRRQQRPRNCVCVCVCVRAKTSVKEEREHTVREEESGFN